MQQTTNYQLNKPEPSDYVDITKISENMDVIDAQLKESQNHRENGDIHVTAQKKQEWDAKETPDGAQAKADAVQGNLTSHMNNQSNPHNVTAAQVGADPAGSASAVQGNLDAHTGNSGIHVIPQNKVYPLSYSKSGAVHALTGLSGVSGTVSCVFTATAAYAAGDTFTVDGVAYTIQLSNGEEPEDNLFVSGASVPVVINTAGKKVNFKAAGGQKLPAGTMDVLAILTQNGTFIVPQTGIYKITAIGHGGFGGFGAWGRDSYTLTGGGGAAGGIATVTKDLKKGESYTITVNDSQSSFGNLVTAIAGGNGSGRNPGIGGSGSGDQVWNGGNGIIGNKISGGGGFVNGADGGSTSSQAPFGGAKGSPGKIAGFKNPPYNMVKDDSIRPYLLNDRNFGSIQNKYFGFGAGCGSSAAARTADGEWIQVITGDDTDIDYPMGANGAIFVEMVLD